MFFIVCQDFYAPTARYMDIQFYPCPYVHQCPIIKANFPNHLIFIHRVSDYKRKAKFDFRPLFFILELCSCSHSSIFLEGGVKPHNPITPLPFFLFKLITLSMFVYGCIDKSTLSNCFIFQMTLLQGMSHFSNFLHKLETRDKMMGAHSCNIYKLVI